MWNLQITPERPNSNTMWSQILQGVSRWALKQVFRFAAGSLCCDIFVPNRPFTRIVMACTLLIRMRNIMMGFISLLGVPKKELMA